MIIDAFKEVGGLASTDVTPEGFLYDVKIPTPFFFCDEEKLTDYRLEDMLFFLIISILMTR